jgi:hypothetical protein
MIQNMSKPRRASNDIKRSLPAGRIGPQGWGETGLAGEAVAMEITLPETSRKKGWEADSTELKAWIIMDQGPLDKHFRPWGKVAIRPPKARIAPPRAGRAEHGRLAPSAKSDYVLAIQSR